MSKPEDETKLASDSKELTEIVMYLDGELEAARAEVVENELAEHAGKRRLADDLDRTWRMLDILDEEDVQSGEQFTQQTLDAISRESAAFSEALETTPEPTSRKPLLSRTLVRQFVAWFVAGCAAGFLGIICGQWISDSQGQADEGRRLLQDYNLMQNLTLYRVVPTTESLEQLNLPAEDPGPAGAAVRPEQTTGQK